MDPKDLYKTVYDTRNLEISLFWQRSNYFLVLNTGLALGYFNIKNMIFALFLSIFGIITSYFWYRVCLGSKYWQSRWEERLMILELHYKSHNIIPNDDEHLLFSASPEDIKRDVTASINRSSHKGFRKFIDCMTLNKPSVSYEMTKLSILFIIGWLVLFAFALSNIFQRCIFICCPTTG